MSPLPQKPIIPSTVIAFGGQQIPRVPPNFAEIVAVPIVSDWGPVGSDAPGPKGTDGGTQLVDSFPAYTTLYGDSDTPGRTAVAGAFAGSGLPGTAGAGGVLVHRMAGASKAKASVTINETGGATPGLTLTGRYYGSRGNRLGYTIDADPSNALRDRLRITLDSVVIETYLYDQTDVTGLAAAINDQSNVVRATDVEAAAVRLLAGSGALVGGDDGATLTGADHIAAQTALNFGPYELLAVYDITPTGSAGDATILATWVAWVQAQNAANRPVMMVVGGAPAESITDALARTNACEDPHVLNVGVGTYHDDLLNADLSTSQLAPRVAGMLAALGQKRALTRAQVGGLHIVGDTGAPLDAIQTAVQGGVTVLMPSDSPDADVEFAKGVSTWTQNTSDRPQDVFGDPRLVRIMDIYVRNMKQWGDRKIIGQGPVNDDTRDAVRGEARRLQDELLLAGLILPGNAAVNPPIPAPFVNVDPPGDPSLLDAIPYEFGWQFARTANAILGQGTVR